VSLKARKQSLEAQAIKANDSPELYRRPSLRLGLSTESPLYTCEVSHYLLEASRGAYAIVSQNVSSIREGNELEG
jgi:hypothetical protein